MDKLWIDIETYSSTSLDAGVYRYVLSPDFQILMAAYSTDGENVHVALGEDAIRAIPGLRDPSVLKVAHNAAFERICFSQLLGLPVGEYLPPEEWSDTMARAGVHGHPQSLDKLARALGAPPKDSAGTRLINLFCKPNRKKARNLPEDYPLEWLDFISYCEQDVATLIEVDRALRGFPTETERSIFWADQHINDRGIFIDEEMARLAMEADQKNAYAHKRRVFQITEGAIENAGSVQQVLKWLQGSGLTDIRDLQKATVAQFLARDTLTRDQREVLELRQELALAASKKFSAALDSAAPDSRLRGSFRYFGAHTGRWSGRGTQLQNLPRDQMDSEDRVEAARLDLVMGEGLPTSDLKKLVRPMFTGPFTVVDYSAIEARVVAWLAGEQWALDAFAAGRDIYVETGKRMGGLTRSQGKVAVLALGYNGGINSLKALGGDRKALENIARRPGSDPDLRLSAQQIDDGLQLLVDQWRAANPKIVQLWKLLGAAFEFKGTAGPLLRVDHRAGLRGKTVLLQLPSGRAISYHGLRGTEEYTVKDPRTGRLVKKSGPRFVDPRSGALVGTYGGRLVENATQAVARDIMAEAIVRLEDNGFRVVGHVHDEIIIEGEHDVDAVRAVMNDSPAWATGLPIDSAGFTCRRYRKG